MEVRKGELPFQVRNDQLRLSTQALKANAID